MRSLRNRQLNPLISFAIVLAATCHASNAFDGDSLESMTLFDKRTGRRSKRSSAEPSGVPRDPLTVSGEGRVFLTRERPFCFEDTASAGCCRTPIRKGPC